VSTPTVKSTSDIRSATAKNGDEGLITAAEVASMLGVSPSTVLDWHQAGEIPSFKFGVGMRAPVRFRRSEVLEWVESKRTVSSRV
jgi:excisionase family DNA binding protein